MQFAIPHSNVNSLTRNIRLYSWFERMMRSMYIHTYVIYVRVFLYACKKNSVRGVESLENTVTRFGIKKVRAIFAFKWDPNLRNFPPCTSTRKAKKRDGLRKNSRSGMLNSAAVRYTGCSQFQFHRSHSTLARFCSVLFFFFFLRKSRQRNEEVFRFKIIIRE